MDGHKDRTFEALLKHLIEHGPDDIATVFGRAFELAMQIERERFLGTGLYERTDNRRGYANGYKPKRIDTPAGTIAVDVPKTAGHDGAPFYPQSLERGRRSVRAVMRVVAEMYVKGGPCCTDPAWDSVREVRCIAGRDDESCADPLPHPELAILQRRAA